MNKNQIKNIFRAIGLAMGIAVVVLNIIGTAPISTYITLLGIGLTVISLAYFGDEQK